MKTYDEQSFPSIGDYPSLRNCVPLVPPIGEREYLGELWFDEFPDDTSIPMIIGEDGMPQFVPQELALAPEFNPKTFICIADETEYVLMNGNAVLQTFAASDVTEDDFVLFDKLTDETRAQLRMQLVQQFMEQAKQEVTSKKETIRVVLDAQRKFVGPSGKVLATFRKADVDEDNGVSFSSLKTEEARQGAIDLLVPQVAAQLADNMLADPSVKAKVQPRRLACRYYHAQILPSEDDVHSKTIVRLCTALATTNGSVYNIRDSKVLACTMRQDETAPKDRVSLKVIREFEIEQARRHAAVSVEEDDFKIPEVEAMGIFGGNAVKETE